MNQLEILHCREIELIEQLKNVQGSIDEKEKSLDNSPIITNYKSIFIEYSNLVQDLEALKRGIFIQWYGANEPFIYSGIKDLDRTVEKLNIEVLCRRINAKQLDAEAQTMILHYYRIAEWYFDDFINFNEYIQTILNWNNRHNYLDLNDMSFRGQMGIYWKGFIDTKFHNIKN